MLQNANPLRKSAPWPPNISHEHVFCTAPTTENASFQILFKCPTPAIVFGHATKPSRFSDFWQGAHNPLRRPRETTSERPKVVQTCDGVRLFDISTSKSAPGLVCFAHFDLEMCFGHNGVHFFDISTSKSAPRRVFFVHFDLEMCFAPQQRALFRHLNFQKWSGAEVFCKFWLRNALRATTACTFSTSQLLKPELRCFVHLDLEICFAPQLRAIFHLSSPQTAPHPPTFRPSGATNHWRTQCFATLLPFRAPASSVFWLDSFSSLIFFLFFSSLTLHTSAFSSVHIVGSLTSKLPSIISYIL